MPLYEYECTKCGERVEVIQKVSDPPYSHCTTCGSEMRKLISAPAIQFKGSGFYKTDYAASGSGSPGGDSKGESRGEPKPESTNETKAESKSESKAESKSESKAESRSESKRETKSNSKSESKRESTSE